MKQFYNFNGVDGLSIEDIEAIASKGGRVTSTGYSFSCPVAVAIIPQAPEWGTRVINTQGMGNCGTIVLVGRTPRARAILEGGKVAWLRGHGVSGPVAMAAVKAQYGMEPDVALFACALVSVRGEYRGNSHREFDAWSGMPSGLSYRRKEAALAISNAAGRK